MVCKTKPRKIYPLFPSCWAYLGDGADVFLASAELAAVAAILGKLPSPAEYLNYAEQLDTMASDIYRYLNFNEIASFQDAAEQALIPAINVVTV